MLGIIRLLRANSKKNLRDKTGNIVDLLVFYSHFTLVIVELILLIDPPSF